MENLKPGDLKSILHSRRANIYYLEHCRVLVNGGRVEYVTDEGKKSLYWNISIANTTTVMLGTGTSVKSAPASISPQSRINSFFNSKQIPQDMHNTPI